MAFYEDLRDDVAVPLIQEFGAQVEVITTTSGNATTTRNGKVVFAQVESKGNGNYGDTGIQIGDWYCLAEVATSPIKGDIIKQGSIRYGVVFVEPIMPGGIILAYKLWVRRV